MATSSAAITNRHTDNEAGRQFNARLSRPQQVWGEPEPKAESGHMIQPNSCSPHVRPEAGLTRRVTAMDDDTLQVN
jgi:hypothetical protein